MNQAFLCGLLAASSLVIGSILDLYIHISRRILGLIMAFGVGVLLSAISFELVEEAFKSSNQTLIITAGMVTGAVVFTLGDYFIERRGGRNHRKLGGSADQNAGMAIFLGTVLDGIPESLVLGLGLINGGKISLGILVAVFISNLPEAVGSTAGLRSGGWKKNRIIILWAVVTLISGLASLAGYVFFRNASGQTLALTMSFAGGALLTMLADTMVPEAFKDSGKLAGFVTVLGFALAYSISVL